MVSQQLRLGVIAAHQVAAEHYLVAPRQHGERAEVEDLVVEGTKREAVRHHVRPARLEPLDVRSFEADRVAAHAQVVPADAAAVFVGEQNLLPERGIAAANGQITFVKLK